MNRIKVLSLAIIVFAVLLTSCNSKKKEINVLSDIVYHTIGVPAGSISDELVLSKFPDAKFTYFDNVLEAALALKAGRINVVAADEPLLRNVIAKNPGLRIMDEMITLDGYCFAVKHGNYDLKQKIDDTIEFLKKTGLIEDMIRRWLPEIGQPSRMPELNLKPMNGILRFGTAPITEPFSFLDDSEKTVGLDIELAHYVAMQMGMGLEIITMPFGELLTSVDEGKVDMVGSCITFSLERAEKVLFSIPYYIGGIAALIREKN